MPSLDELLRLLSLQDYNTRVVLLGTFFLGLAAGIVGPFMLLRKRSLMGDAISHATLPGLGLAFIVMAVTGGTGKYLPGLLLGAVVFGVLGMLSVTAISKFTRLKEDAALGIVLSVYFGFGIAVLGLVQKMSTGHAAGLQSFIYGKTASMLAGDAWLTGISAALVFLACALLFKEFGILCFDANFARAQGWPAGLLDALLMCLVVAVTVIGLQAVGLILVIALLIVPAAAARFWTDRLLRMVAVSAVLGGVSCLLGAAASALVPKLPAGAVIVVTAAMAFMVSMIVGPRRGLLVQLLSRLRLNRQVARQHLLRAMYEIGEDEPQETPVIAWEELVEARSWSPGRLRRMLARLRRRGLVESPGEGRWALTARGAVEAQRLVRNHRLWEIYLVTHADVAPSRVDRGADRLEHLLEPELMRELETRLAEAHPDLAHPASPHPVGRAAGG